GERQLLPVAGPAAYLTRVSRVNSFERPASVFSFAFRHNEKAPPGHITDCLREMMLFHHHAYVQILDRDRVKTPHKIGRNLVVKILATARDFQVRFGDFDPLLRTPLRSFLFARKSPLLSLQVVQRALEVARILDLFSVRECGETGDAYINANRLSGKRERFRLGRLANNQPIPTVNAARDPKLFALSFNRAGETDATGSNAGNCELVAFDRAGPNLLILLRESVIAVFALESGESRFLSILNASKEALESFLHAFKRVLLDHPSVPISLETLSSNSLMSRAKELFNVSRLVIIIEARESIAPKG